MDSVTLIED